MPSYTIRPASPEDLPLILALITELADYEKLAHEVVATPEALQAHLFGAQPAAEVVIGEVGGEPAGFALYFTSFSTFLARPGLYLEDLFVKPAYRGVGLGRGLLRHLAGVALERGYGRFEWRVLDWNELAIGFYQAHGAEMMEGWTTCRVTGPALETLARGE